jgi:hypothetical protein
MDWCVSPDQVQGYRLMHQQSRASDHEWIRNCYRLGADFPHPSNAAFPAFPVSVMFKDWDGTQAVIMAAHFLEASTVQYSPWPHCNDILH